MIDRSQYHCVLGRPADERKLLETYPAVLFYSQEGEADDEYDCTIVRSITAAEFRNQDGSRTNYSVDDRRKAIEHAIHYKDGRVTYLNFYYEG